MTSTVPEPTPHLPPRSADEACRFAAESEEAVLRLRGAFARVMESSPVSVQRATDLQRLLGVEASLAWQVFRLAGSSDPLAAVTFVPTPGSMAKVLRIMRERGYDGGALDQAATAYAHFETVVEHHALDRETFDRMIAGLRGEREDLIAVGDRRAAFRSNTHIWGVQAAALYRAGIVYPGEDPTTCDSASIRGCTGLRRLRAVPPVTLAKRLIISEARRIEDAEKTRLPAPLTLLEDFCSQPPPKLEMTHERGAARDVVRIDGLGRDSVVDCFVYDHHARTGRTWAGEKMWGAFVTVNIPCEVLVFDLLLPEGWSVPSTVVAAVSGNVSDHQSAEDDPDSYPLPVSESARHLGSELSALEHPALPRCAPMVNAVLRRIGAAGTRFDVYRCQVRFPILNSVILVEVKARGAD